MQLCTKWLPNLKKAFRVVCDNAPAHKSLIPWLREKGVKVAEQAPYSPDHNLAENAHRDIKEGPRSARCENNEELAKAIEEEWKAYTVQQFQKTYCPKYRRRLQATNDRSC